MERILTKIKNEDGVDYIYECSITDDDRVCFAYGKSQGRTSDGPNIGETISSLTIHYNTLIEIGTNARVVNIKYPYGNGYGPVLEWLYIVKEDNDDIIEIANADDKIVLSKSFLSECLSILGRLWIDDPEQDRQLKSLLMKKIIKENE